jgi:Glyoxalase/Bleomycin resistance protein/Dioxygenase superfamily
LRLESIGYEWSVPLSGMMRVQLADGIKEFALTCHYSLNSPTVELVQAVPDTPWAARDGGAPHHLGYFVDNFLDSHNALIDLGYAVEAVALVDDKPGVFAYHLTPEGFRIEIVDRSTMPDWEVFIAAVRPPG